MSQILAFFEKVTPFTFQQYSHELIASLRLIRSNNIGSITYHKLIKYFGSASSACEQAEKLLQRNNPNFQLISEDLIKKEIEQTYNYGADFLTLDHKSYPRLLKQIPNPPPILTIKGNIELLNKNCLSIVGSRNASAGGRNFTYNLAKELADANIITCSGLARGIDTSAHQASVDTGTIAVIAGGIDNNYPPENSKLKQQIEQQGLLVTEMPFGNLPKAHLFPKRNAIIAGIAKGTIIVEATLKSGSLTTAKYAAEYNRDIFAVPGFPYDPRAKGTNLLIKQGAYIVEHIDDILAEVNFSNQTCSKQQLNLSSFANNNDEVNNQNESYKNINEIDKISQSILNLLSTCPIDRDMLLNQINCEKELFDLSLIELEINDKIIKTAGNKLSLKN